MMLLEAELLKLPFGIYLLWQIGHCIMEGIYTHDDFQLVILFRENSG